MKRHKFESRSFQVMLLILSAIFILFMVSPLFAADAQIMSGFRKTASVRHMYVTGTGDIAAVLTIPQQGTHGYELISFDLNLSAAGGANSLTVTKNSGLGTAYDTILLSQDMTSVEDLVQTYFPGETVFANDDTIDFAWTNASARTYGLTVKYRRK